MSKLKLDNNGEIVTAQTSKKTFKDDPQHPYSQDEDSPL